jgi:hypothetical protein
MQKTCARLGYGDITNDLKAAEFGLNFDIMLTGDRIEALKNLTWF